MNFLQAFEENALFAVACVASAKAGEEGGRGGRGEKNGRGGLGRREGKGEERLPPSPSPLRLLRRLYLQRTKLP